MLGELHGCSVSSPPSRRPPRVLQVRLTPEMLEQLRNSDGEGLSISFEKDMGLRIGERNHSFSIAPESATVDVYRCSRSRRAPSLEMIGQMTHKLTMRRELGSSISEKLKIRNAEEAAAKQERSVQATDIGMKTKKGMPTMVSRTSTPNPVRSESPIRRSPFLQPRKSPLLVASSTSKVSQIPLRTRLIQNLAIGAGEDAELAAKLKVSVESITNLLAEDATKVGKAWALKDEAFKDIRVWDWKGYTTAERGAVISRASEALDRLGLPVKHAARIRLLHPDKRNGDERNDTSPLSLNAPVTAASLSKDISPKKPNTKVDLLETRTGSSTTSSSTALVNAPPEKRCTAKGILTSGKKPLEKKRKIEAKEDFGKESTKKSKVSDTTTSRVRNGNDDDDDAPKQKKDVHTSVQEKTLPIKSRNKALQVKSSRLVDDSDEDIRSQASPRSSESNHRLSLKSKAKGVPSESTMMNDISSLKKSSKPVERSQTPKAAAKVAPSTGSRDAAEEEANNRTSSITSSTTDRSDQSHNSAGSKSTAPSSAPSPPLPKVKSKFLMTKKTMTPTTSTSSPKPVANRITATISKSKTAPGPASASPAMIKSETPISKSATSNVSQKRKPDCELSPELRAKRLQTSPEPQAKRLQTIDLQNMARDYTRLYPEYRGLHEKVLAKVDDQALFGKFMKLHNQMSNWKQTLYAAERDFD